MQRQHVAHFALVAFGPELLLRARVDQVRSDADFVSGAHDRAGNQRTDTQLLRNLPQRPVRFLVAQHRWAGAHPPQAAELSQIDNQRFMHARSEVVLLGIAGQVFERQYRQRTAPQRPRGGPMTFGGGNVHTQVHFFPGCLVFSLFASIILTVLLNLIVRAF